MIISRQAMDVYFKSLSHQKILKQKIRSPLSCCPTLCSFWEQLLFSIRTFSLINHAQLTQFVFSYTRPSLVIAQSAVDVGAKVADIMFPPRLLPQNTTSPLLRTPHHSPLPSLKEYTDTNAV